MPFWPIHPDVGSYPYLTNTRRIAERTQSVPSPYLVMPFWPIHPDVGSYPYLTNTRRIAERTQSVPSPYLVMPFWPIHPDVGSYPYLTNTRRITERTQSVRGKGGHPCILSTVGSCLPVHKFLCLCHLIFQHVLT